MLQTLTRRQRKDLGALRRHRGPFVACIPTSGRFTHVALPRGRRPALARAYALLDRPGITKLHVWSDSERMFVLTLPSRAAK